MKNRSIAYNIFELVSSTIMFILLLVVLWKSLSYWCIIYIPILKDITLSLDYKMFNVAILITIVTILGRWIEGRIKSIIDSINNINKKEVLDGR